MNERQRAIWIFTRATRLEIESVRRGNPPEAFTAHQEAAIEFARYRTENREPPANRPLTREEQAIDQRIHDAYMLASERDLPVAKAWKLVKAGEVAR